MTKAEGRALNRAILEMLKDGDASTPEIYRALRQEKESVRHRLFKFREAGLVTQRHELRQTVTDPALTHFRGARHPVGIWSITDAGRDAL